MRFPISVNGDDDKGQSVQIPHACRANQRASITFTVTLRTASATPRRSRSTGSASSPPASETPEPGGIAVDNVRHAVVEVRDRLPMLVVDGRPATRDKQEGDGFYLQPAVHRRPSAASTGCTATLARPRRRDLRPFTARLM